ncbi:MAG TPA: hypothetical protein HPP56_09815 [Nitrospirae bacterium]|nr:hypothetical protein [Nitrospirota bacterium]
MEGLLNIPNVFVPRHKRFKTQEIKELVNELKELRARKQQLINDNAKLLNRLDTIKSEIEGAKLVAQTMTREIELTKEKIENYPKELDSLEVKKEELIEDINRCQVSMKTATRNIKNFLNMRSHLEDELLSIINEKAVFIKKLKDVETGVNILAEQRQQKAPEIKQYDMVLRQLSRVFKEAENKIDVSIKFSTKMKKGN